MMILGRKTLALLLCLALCVCLLPGTALAVDVVASGTCGDNLTWTLDSNGLLTISGTGKMASYDYEFNSDVPWYNNCSGITQVAIGDGVTSIGNYAFYGCSGLTSVMIPESVIRISTQVFYGCDNLKDIYYNGTREDWDAIMKGCDVEQTTAALHCADSPTITAQPASVTAAAGTTATFKVTATGAVSYQWQASTDGGKTWVNSGANGNKTATLSFTAAAAHNGYMFRCVVKSSSGQSVTSNAVTLTVK